MEVTVRMTASMKLDESQADGTRALGSSAVLGHDFMSTNEVACSPLGSAKPEQWHADRADFADIEASLPVKLSTAACLASRCAQRGVVTKNRREFQHRPCGAGENSGLRSIERSSR